jgi:hypothetical protein
MLAARLTAIYLTFLILATACTSSVQAADVTIKEGVVVSASKNTLVIADKEKKQHSYEVGDKVPVRINGKSGKLEELKKTTPVSVTINKRGRVTQVATIDLMKKLADGRRYWR